MILSVPILGVLKSFLQATDHPYAQVCSYVLEGSIGKAIRSWETARHRLIASASALSPHPHNLPHSNSHGHGASSESLGHGHHPSFSSRRAAPDGAVGAGERLRRGLLRNLQPLLTAAAATCCATCIGRVTCVAPACAKLAGARMSLHPSVSFSYMSTSSVPLCALPAPSGTDVSPALLPRAQTMHEKPPTQPPLGGKSYRRLMD